AVVQEVVGVTREVVVALFRGEATAARPLHDLVDETLGQAGRAEHHRPSFVAQDAVGPRGEENALGAGFKVSLPYRAAVGTHSLLDECRAALEVDHLPALFAQLRVRLRDRLVLIVLRDENA